LHGKKTAATKRIKTSMFFVQFTGFDVAVDVIAYVELENMFTSHPVRYSSHQKKKYKIKVNFLTL
jgi:hypothetical protein